MIFKRWHLQLVVLLLVFANADVARAQVYASDTEWKESETPPPPAFDVKKLLTFEVPRISSLVYGVDPASVSISQSDSLVRYVMVATSPSGARSVIYEALRCSTGEFKTYARYSADGKWTPVANPEWRSVFAGMASKHPLWFAKAGACDAAAPAGSVSELVTKLKNPGRYLDQ
jgi:CNP1-like family